MERNASNDVTRTAKEQTQVQVSQLRHVFRVNIGFLLAILLFGKSV